MIFLDFDGVLFDTANEAYAVSVIASGKCNSIDEIDFQSEHYKNFKKLRYLISPAWQYKYLLEELELNENLKKIEKNFLQNVQLASRKNYSNFESSFFNVRNDLKKNHYKKWLKLNTPFEFLAEVNFLFHDFKYLTYIITTKDKSTVLELLSSEGLEFDEKRIFDKDDYEKFGSKKIIIKSLMIYDKRGILIDDSDKHIKECLQINGIKCFQPDWGYVGLDSKTNSLRVIINEINILLNR